jgi:hypothetical protein
VSRSAWVVACVLFALGVLGAAGAGSSATRARTGSDTAPAGPAPTAPFSAGIVAGGGGTSGWEATALKRLKASVVRDEYSVATPIAELQAAAELVKDASGDGSGRLNLLISEAFGSSSDAVKVGQIARALGPGLLSAIELGNESFDPSRGYLHARFCRASLAEASGTGVPIVCQFQGGAAWQAGLFSDGTFVPDGWSLHIYPYDGQETTWPMMLEQEISDMQARGVLAPIYITETGVPIDDGRTLYRPPGGPGCTGSPTRGYTPDDAAAIMTTFYTQIAPGGPFGGYIRSALTYQASDQRTPGQTDCAENYFGILRSDQIASKGAYTTAIESELSRWRGQLG